MRPPIIGILLYAPNGLPRNAAEEDKYRLLVEKITARAWAVRTLNYHDSNRARVRAEARACAAVLVWINPTEPDLDRTALDTFLRELATDGVHVSAQPDTILRLGTKDVLVATRSIGWSVDVAAYGSATEFAERFPAAVRRDGARVVKQYRGHSGQGVWKVTLAASEAFHVQSAVRGAPTQTFNETGLAAFFAEAVFAQGTHVIDQQWVATMDRGMVRAYLCGATVVGFGFQEIVALHPSNPGADFTRTEPSRRHYYTQDCHLFRTLRERLESQWIPELQAVLGLRNDDLPLLWDADFFFGERPQPDYILCEINASCVSPFPDSAVTPLLDALELRLRQR